jgi:hypothetical protein
MWGFILRVRIASPRILRVLSNKPSCQETSISIIWAVRAVEELYFSTTLILI